MTWQEYQNLPIFLETEHIYPKTSTFGIGSIFAIYCLDSKIRYLKIVYANVDLWRFNLAECDKKGNFLSCRQRGMSRTEIIDFIDNNEWRLYKQYFGKRELIPKVKGNMASKKRKNIPNRN
jgi:hypothetical protein